VIAGQPKIVLKSHGKILGIKNMTIMYMKHLKQQFRQALLKSAAPITYMFGSSSYGAFGRLRG
jgi:hypothetical protein